MPDLNVLRISRDTETSSSLVRQRARLEEYDRQHGCEVAAWVEDATVSGAVNLDQRPKLGKYLREPLVDTWDRLKVVSQDRITRDDMHWWEFVGWLLKSGKDVVVLDDPGLDITTPTGRTIAGIKAMQATEYRNAIVKKRNDQLSYYREHDLWGGGNWPFGYRAVRDRIHMGERRYRLVIDPVTGPLVLEAYRRLTSEGDTLGDIVADWNNRGVMTAQDHQRHTNAINKRENVKTEVQGTKWSTTSLRTVLRRPTLMGHAVDDGKTRTRGGLPVRWADPILKQHEFDLLQDVLNQRGAPYKGPRGESDPLIRILYCACGRKMYTHRTTKNRGDGTKIVHEYYVCSSGSRAQQGARGCEYRLLWRRTLLRSALEESFLAEIGDVEITRRRFIPGQDRSGEIKDLKTAVENLTNSIAMATSTVAIEALTSTLEARVASLATLESEPVVQPVWEELGTGQTYREVWAEQDWAQRGRMLRSAGVRMYVGGKPTAPDLNLVYPGDLAKRAEDALGGTIDLTWTEQWNQQIETWRSEETS